MSINRNAPAEYLGAGDPALKHYYPVWLDNMADNATVEGSMLDGAIQGAEAVRSVVLAIRSFYDRQEFKFAGPYSADGFLEDYVAEVRGEPPAVSSWSPVTPLGRLSTSWRVTGHAARCCDLPASSARGSPERRSRTTSPRSSYEVDRMRRLRCHETQQAACARGSEPT